MPALIETLIDKVDTSEQVGLQIAAILTLESAGQQALALAATPTPKDPRLWALKVFHEASNPVEEFREVGEDEGGRQIDATPVVNVTFENTAFPEGEGNTFERQKGNGTFNIDVYGYGVSTETPDGHDPGDRRAALEAQRAMRLVRNIIMSAPYNWLGYPPGAGRLVTKRWPQTITAFTPQLDGRSVDRVVGMRLALRVDFIESAPQHVLQELEIISATVIRAGDGRIYLNARYE